MTPVWTGRALRDVAEALTRIAAEDPVAARLRPSSTLETKRQHP